LAQGQGGVVIQGGATGGVQEPVKVSGVVGRTFHYFSPGCGPPGTMLYPVPGSDPIIATSVEFAGSGVPLARALLANGDVYDGGGDAGTWHYMGNLFQVGPVQSQGTTWGRIKAERR